MGKRKDINEQFDFDEDAVRNISNELEFDLDDDEFFEQFRPEAKRAKNARRRDARRKIEEYWENRELAERLDEYYYHTDD